MIRDYIYIFVIIILSIAIYTLWQSNNSLRTSLATCSTTISLQNQSIKQQAAMEQQAHDKVRLAQKQADEYRENSQKELKNTLGEEIKDKTCEGAMSYMFEKSQSF